VIAADVERTGAALWMRDKSPCRLLPLRASSRASVWWGGLSGSAEVGLGNVCADSPTTRTLVITAAVNAAMPGIYNITDDEPAPVSVWLPYLAEMLGAKPPRYVPKWLARLAVGEYGVAAMTELRGSSNRKAKSLLSWRPKWASWRQGFKDGFETRTQSIRNASTHASA